MAGKGLLRLTGLFLLVCCMLPSELEADDLYVYSDTQGSIHVTHTPVTRRGFTLVSTYHSRNQAAPDVSGSLERFSAEIRRASLKYGVEEELIRAVIKAESDFDPYAISSAGALGLMQLMPETAEHMGVQNCFNPAQNIDGGVRYLRKLRERFADPKLAIAAYHAGENRVAAYGDVPPIPTTLEYVDRVLRYYRAFRKIANPPKRIYKVIGADGQVLYTTSPDGGGKKRIFFRVD